MKSGKYFAVSVEKQDPTLELTLNVDLENERADGVRQYPSLQKPKPGSNEELAQKFSGVLNPIKQKQWKKAAAEAVNVLKQLIAESVGQKEESTSQTEVDPLDPQEAFAPVAINKISYEIVESLSKKHTSLDYYHFRSENVYGFLIPLENGAIKEVSFIFPSSEYTAHHSPGCELNLSSANWRREDHQLHKMQVHYLAQDLDTAKKLAASSTLSQEIKEYFEVDFSTSRAQLKTLFSAPKLRISPQTGEVTLYHLQAWYLPTFRKNGLQIQYNWDALRISIMQGDKLIKRKICWSKSSGPYIQSVGTQFELMDGGYIGELDAGQYQFKVHLYGDEVFNYPFEVVQVVSEDMLSEPGSYYSLRTPKHDYARLEYIPANIEIDCHYPLARLMERCKSLESFNMTTHLSKNGEKWPAWEWDTYEQGGHERDAVVRNKPKWTQNELKFQLMFANSPKDGAGRKAAEDGNYSVHFCIDGEEVDRISFTIQDARLIGQFAMAVDEIADFELPSEHEGYLHAFHQ